MALKKLRPSMQSEFAEGLIVDWYDRSICRIDRTDSDTFLLNCLVAWDFTGMCGVRLYFPVVEDFYRSVASKLTTSWEDARLIVQTYVNEYSGDFVAALELNQKLEEVRLLAWPLSIKLQAYICDVDSTMANHDFVGWEDLIRNGTAL